MIKSHQRPRPRKYRKHYRVTNWRDYEQGLKSRGDITLWISDEAIDQWDQNEYKGRGRPNKYSSLAIETVLFIRLLFKLPLRQTEGFISSLFQLMNLDLEVPDHSTLSRRSQTLNPKLSSGTYTDCLRNIFKPLTDQNRTFLNQFFCTSTM